MLSQHKSWGLSDMIKANPATFVAENGERVTGAQWARAQMEPIRRRAFEIYDLCRAYADREPACGRRLASLCEANDVARRLAETYQPQRYFSGKPRATAETDAGSDDGNVAAQNKSTIEDFVSKNQSVIRERAWKHV